MPLDWFLSTHQHICEYCQRPYTCTWHECDARFGRFVCIWCDQEEDKMLRESYWSDLTDYSSPEGYTMPQPRRK